MLVEEQNRALRLARSNFFSKINVLSDSGKSLQSYNLLKMVNATHQTPIGELNVTAPGAASKMNSAGVATMLKELNLLESMLI